MAAMVSTLPPIVLRIETSAPPAEAWTAITLPDRIVEWFTDASPLGAVGTAYRLDFGEGSVVEGVVTELDPGRHFAHTWAWADAEPGQQTGVSWSVDPVDGGGSRITLVHDGWSEAGLDSSARDDHEGYWSGYLDDLAAVLDGDG
jgi:uncharacterized protein YndB with AHSA1/START domain